MRIKRIVTLVCALLLALPAAANDISFGLAKDKAWNSARHLELAQEYGATGHYGVYWNMLSPDNLANPFAWVRDNYLRNGCKPVIVTLLLNGRNEDSIDRSELSEGERRAIGNHQAILDGLYDESLRDFAIATKKAMAETGCTDVVISPMHEGDGFWYAWGMDAIGNNAQSFGAAFAHVVNIFRAEEVPVKFQFNPNRRDGQFEVLRLIDEWFPLVDPYVDQYAISSYNRCGTQDSATEYRSFWLEFAPAYRKLAQYTDKPINVAEVSTSTLCRDDEAKRVWFEEALANLHTWAPQTEEVTFYFGTIEVGEASNDVPIVWGFPTDEGKAWFSELLERFDEATKRSSVEPSPVTRQSVLRPAQRPARPVSNVQSSAQASASERTVALPKTAPLVAVQSIQPVTELSFSESRSWNWEAWADLRTTIGDEPIPGYGTAGTIGQGTIRFNFLNEGRVQSGPSLTFGGVLSDECGDRYWQCQARVEAGYIWRWRPSEVGDYNRLQFGLGVGYRHYGDFGGRPDRLDDGDAYGFVGLTWTAGGTFGD